MFFRKTGKIRHKEKNVMIIGAGEAGKKILATGNGGVKLRTCAGRTFPEALCGCIAALLEGCTPESFFTVSGRFTDKALTHTQLFNALTTGEGTLPLRLLAAAPHWQPRRWNAPAEADDAAAACAASSSLTSA